MPQNYPDRGSPTSMPRWVKVFAVILAVFVLAVVVLHLTGINFGELHHMP